MFPVLPNLLRKYIFEVSIQFPFFADYISGIQTSYILPDLELIYNASNNRQRQGILIIGIFIIRVFHHTVI